MVKSLLPFLSFLFLLISAHAQRISVGGNNKKKEDKIEKRNRINEMIRNEEEGIAGFNKHFVFNFKTHHDGYGIILEKGIAKTPYKSTIFQLEFAEKQHPKENKQSSTDFTNSGFAIFGRPFVYGKQNIFYQAKLGVGKQIMIGGKSNKNGVAVYGILVGGFSAGLARPYYLEFNVPSGAQKLKFTEDKRAIFLSADKIIGGTGLQLGWNEMKFNPGAYGKASLRFDWARFNQVVSAMEFGFGFDYYTSGVVQMVDNPAKSFFPTGFIGLVFGNRK
jgi:hypothetical protein